MLQITPQMKILVAVESRALDEGGRIISLSAVIKLGPSFRNQNRESELQWRRVRRQGELAGILKGAL